MNNNNGKNPWVFLREFIRHPKEVGSVIPSSRFLERRIIEAANVHTAKIVVELGPGTGVITHAILDALPEDSTLLSIEINRDFYNLVNAIDDPRLISHCGSAADLQSILSNNSLDAPDAVISGIPFSTMDSLVGREIVESIAAALAPAGCFVAYQFKDRVATLSQPVFGEPTTTTELKNIPPMRVYRWEKDNRSVDKL